MDVSIEKLNLIQQILLIKDEKLIQAIMKFIESKRQSSEETEGWEDLPDMVRDSIQVSQQQLEEEKGIPLQDVLEKYRARYQK